jgi:hypothetical protein
MDERPDGHFLKRERDGAVLLVHPAPLGRPVGTGDLVREKVHLRVDARIDPRQVVGPERHGPPGREHPLDLGEEALEVEPVKGLRRGDEVDGAVRQPRGLRRSHAVLDARVRGGVLELRRARVGRDDALEKLGEAERRLAVAGATVESEMVRAGETGDGGDEIARIARPEGGVGGGVPGEVVFERHR